MSRQQIGDVARDLTERLDEPRALKLIVYHINQKPWVFKIPVALIEQQPLILEIKAERETAYETQMQTRSRRAHRMRHESRARDLYRGKRIAKRGHPNSP